MLPLVYNITCKDNQFGLCMGERTKVDDFVGAMSYLYNNRREMILFIFIFLALLFYNCFRVLTYQHFTPIHSNISRDLKVFMVFASDFIPYFGNNKDNLGQSFKEIGTYIVMFIGDLIFLEIVILGFFDFNKNTKEEIIKREKTEIRDSNVENIINNEEPIDKTKSIETLV